MTTAAPGVRFGRFLGLAVVVVVIVGGLGWLPTKRFAGDEAVPAMIAGCVISLVAAALAGVLLVVVGAPTPNARMQRAFLAMTVRLAAVLVLGVAGALSGLFAQLPLLFWLATTYVVLLPLEVKLAIAE